MKTKPLAALALTLVLTMAFVHADAAKGGKDKDKDSETSSPPGRHLGALAPGAVVDLEADEPVWWDGIYVPSAVTASCDVPTSGGCLDYFLDVPTGMAVLRVSLDKSDIADRWKLEVFDPAGTAVYSLEPITTAEGRFLDPVQGQWRVRLTPVNVEESYVHVRAHAATSIPLGPSNGLPDIVAIPPWEFSFAMPIDTLGQVFPVVPAGMAPTSCTAEETVLHGAAVRCLRFSFGWGNIGDGILDLRIGQPAPGTVTAPVTQVVETDGVVEESAAGTATIHTGHLHYHADDAYLIEAFHVEDGEFAAAVLSAKRGSCTVDYLLVDWWSWLQDAKGAAKSDCGTASGQWTTANPTVGRIAISRGWADVYPGSLTDNYVDLTGKPDGEYILRATVNPKDHMRESDTANNMAYSHILIHGSSVETLERGYGSDPWDADKVILDSKWSSLQPMPEWLA